MTLVTLSVASRDVSGSLPHVARAAQTRRIAVALRRYGEARGALEAAVGYAVENNSGQCRHRGIQWAVSDLVA
jgi:hypothetical protein